MPAGSIATVEGLEKPLLLASLDEALDLLAACYSFRRPNEVEAFPCVYANRIPVLLEAAEWLTRYFGAGASHALEVFVDPEKDAPRPELFILVQTSLPSDQAIARLDQLGEAWWFAHSPSPPGTIVIDGEFV
jgi:hypothetical protein